jgi:hypothetical protein
MKLSQSPDMEYGQKCTETSINIMKITQPSNSSSVLALVVVIPAIFLIVVLRRMWRSIRTKRKDNTLKLMHQQRINNGKSPQQG